MKSLLLLFHRGNLLIYYILCHQQIKSATSCVDLLLRVIKRLGYRQIYAAIVSEREVGFGNGPGIEIDKKLKQGPPSDVRIMNSLPLAVIGKIITEGVLIYCRNDEARVDYETAVRSAYFDFLPFIQNYQRTYLE